MNINQKGYDIYIKVNNDNCVTSINSNIFIDNLNDWILVDSNVQGDKGAHAQGNYLPKPFITDEGYYRYKYENDNIVERSEEEINGDAFLNIIIQKKSELSAECEKAIVAGIDVGDAHYSLTIEDQANILAWMAVAQTGKAVPYHQDGQPCRIYTAEEFMEVANAAVAFKTAQTTYCNLLMRQVESMTDVDEVKAVKYGITQLEGEYAEQYQIIMASLVGDNGETNS